MRRIKMKGVITCVKHSEAQGNVYFLAGKEHGFRCIELRQMLTLSAGDVADDDGKTIIDGDDAKKFKKAVYSALESEISQRLGKEVYKKGVDGLDNVTAVLWP